MTTMHLTKEQFLRRIADYEKNPDSFRFLGKRPALIDFFASWCGPCKMFAPVLEEVAREYAGKVDVYKVDVEQEEELATRFGVRSIPTLVFIPMNGPIKTVQGAVGKPQLEALVKEYLFDEG